MKLPSKERIEALRREYPKGCRVELLRMDDPQAPPVGTTGSVIAVDDLGTIHVVWSTGSGLGVAYGQDLCRRIDDA